MSEIEIDGIANFDGIKFKFNPPMVLNPNEPFPDVPLTSNGELQLGSVGVNVEEDFPINGGGANFKFSVGAEFNSALGVYRKTDNLLKALKDEGLNQQFANLLNAKIGSDENVCALRWGYKLTGGVEGQVPLISLGLPVELTFGVKGKTGGLALLLHTTPKGDTVRDALKKTFESWKLPAQVDNFDDLNPKTTVAFETLSTLDASLGVSYGYNFNWVRESLQIGKLNGNLGLKIEVGAKAQFGFKAVGDYALALTRESDAETLRVQVFKLKQKGISMAFDGGVSGQLNQIPLPDNLDEFLTGVFNLDKSQVFKDFQKVFDGDATISELLGDAAADEVNKFLERVTGLDLVTGMEKLKGFITKWHEMPHEVSSYLYDLLGKAAGEENLKDLKEFLTTVRDLLKDHEAVADEVEKRIIQQRIMALIESHLEGFAYFTDPIGGWLTTISRQSVTSLLINFEDEQKEFAKRIDEVLAILDGGDLENILKKFQKEIDERLKLDLINDANPDKWLRKRLKEFFGDNPLGQKLNEIQALIQSINDKAREFYVTGYKALLEKYSVDVHYAFQRTTESTALIDFTIDFSAEPEKAAKCLKLAKEGNFNDILLGAGDAANCVKINQAVLTHDIKRSTHLGVNLPNFSATRDHFTNSLVTGKFVEAAEGKLWVFNLKAEDILEKKKSLSKLTVMAEISDKEGIETFSETGNTLDYSFLFGKEKVDRKYIEQRYETAANVYLRSALPAEENSFSKYLTDLAVSLNPDDPDEFGKVLTALRISMPGKILSFWKDVPSDLNGSFYTRMSATVQRTFREWIPLNFFQGPEEYEKTSLAFPLLVYASLPPMIGDERDDGVFYWKFDDAGTREQIFESAGLQNKLREFLATARKTTSDPRYLDSHIDDIISFVFTNINAKKIFADLCDLELDIIRGTTESAQAFQRFEEENDPQDKRKALGDFGMKFVDTFNEEIGGVDVIPRGSLRPLGLLLLLRIIQLVRPELNDETKFAAIFEVNVLKSGVANFDDKRAKFLKGKYPEDADKDDFALRQRIVNVDALTA